VESEPRAYDKLRDSLVAELGSPRDIALLLPDLVVLLARLCGDPRVPGRYKACLAGGLAYILSPVDLLPERVVGPIGILDDLIVAVVVLDLLLNHLPEEIVLEHWSGRSELLSTVQQVLHQADRWIGRERLSLILEHLGLRPQDAPD